MDAPLQHIAFIMDGNGRWAKQRGLARTEGHKEGAQRIFEIARHTFEYWHIPYITLYAFSTENWTRPVHEVNTIFRLLKTYLKRKKSILVDNKIRFRTIGDLSKLPQSAQTLIEEIVHDTATFSSHTLTIALNYGAREEILRAIQSLLQANRVHSNAFTWNDLAQLLYTHDLPDPDLIIRTSGEQRLSNFLLLQAAYSELYFTPVYWPDFSTNELNKAIEHFLQRTRRFGNIE